MPDCTKRNLDGIHNVNQEENWFFFAFGYGLSPYLFNCPSENKIQRIEMI